MLLTCCSLCYNTSCTYVREAAEAEKREKKAKAKAEKLAAREEAAARAAAAAADAAAMPVIGAEGAGLAAAQTTLTPAAAARRGSIAQMRRTFRTFSLMQLTKVLLDGTLVPKIEEAVELPPSGVSRIGTAATGRDTDRSSDVDTDQHFPSRPSTGVRITFSDSGILDSPEDASPGDRDAGDNTGAGGDAAGEMPGAGGRPSSKGANRPSTRSSMWDLPPLGRAFTPPAAAGRVSSAPRATVSALTVPAIDAISEVASEVTGTDGSEEAEIFARPVQTPADHSGHLPARMTRQLSDLEPARLKDGSVEALSFTGSESAVGPPNGPESELSQQSSTVDSDVLDLLSDLKLTSNAAAVASSDAFVQRRTTRIASISDSGLKAADGRPPSGLLFNMVKPGTPSNNPGNPLLHSLSKSSPMDKINKAKELPRLPISKLKKPTSGKADVTADATCAKQSAKVDSAVSQKQAAPQQAPAVLQATPPQNAKPKGLYIIPGTATVATFAQKPPAQKPSRQIVYTTRVLVQQQLREYINSPAASAVHASFDSTQDDSTDSDLRFIIGRGSRTANVIEFSDILGPPDVSARTSGGRLALLGAMPIPPTESIGEVRKDSAELRVLIPTAEKEASPELGPGNAVPSAGTLTDVVDSRMPPQAISDSESDRKDGKLQLSMAEWSLILDAAREQALNLNMDILQQNELEDQINAADRYDHSPTLGAESEEEFEEDQFGSVVPGGVMSLSNLHEYYGEALDSQDEYQYEYSDDDRPMPPLTVGRAIKLYGEREPSSEHSESTTGAAHPAAGGEAAMGESDPVIVPTLAAIGSGGFSLYARTSHTAQGLHAGLAPAGEPAAEESMLDKFLKTAGVPLVPTAIHRSDAKASQVARDDSPTSQRKVSPQRARDHCSAAPSSHPESSGGDFRPTSPRAVTPKHAHRKLVRSEEPEVPQQRNRSAECGAGEATASLDLRPEPVDDLTAPLTVVKLVKPVLPVTQSLPQHHGSAANTTELVPASAVSDAQHIRPIVLPMPVIVGEDGDSSVYTL